MTTNNTSTGFKQPGTQIAADRQRSEDFKTLYGLNLNEKVEKKNGLTYLTWAHAWAEFKKVYPSATFRVVHNPDTNLPYFNDPDLGIMVFTEVTAGGLTQECFLPVMDPSNRAMKATPYTYQQWDKYKNGYVEKRVEAATMFDINKAMMRCLVKNIAMFGLGLYIYASEDLPEQIDATSQQQPSVATPAPKTTRKRTAATPPTPDRYAGIKSALSRVSDTKQLLDLYNEHKNEVDGNPEIKTLFTQRKNELAA